MTAPNPPSTLSLGQQIGWAAGTHGTSTMIGVLVTIMLGYLTTVLGIEAAIAGAIIFASRLYDMIIDPLMGHVSDRTQSRFGRRRVYLLWGAAACFVSFVLVFNVSMIDDMTTRVVYVAALLFLFNTAYTIFNIPYLAMPAEMTEHYHERTVLMSYRVVFFTTSSLFIFLGTAQLTKVFGAQQGYALFGWLVGGVMALSMLVAFLSSARAPRTERTEGPRPALAEQIRLVMGNRPFVVYLGVKLLQLTAQASSNAALIFFGVYVLKNQQALLIAFGSFFPLGTLLAIPAWTWAGRRIGKRNGFMLAAVSYAIIMLTWLLSQEGETTALLGARLFLLGAAVAGILVMGFAILPDTIEYDRRRTGINREGVYAGLYSTMEKLAAAFGPLIFGGYLSAAGFESSQGGAIVAQPDAALSAIYIGMAVFPAAASLLSAALLSLYDLDEAKLKATLRNETAAPSAST
ncbi:MAG: MFS transporter [Rhodospirillaceae bacterium]|nr:MFS transporter [Rhodospirillaceae bacterium]